MSNLRNKILKADVIDNQTRSLLLEFCTELETMQTRIRELEHNCSLAKGTTRNCPNWPQCNHDERCPDGIYHHDCPLLKELVSPKK